MLDSLDTKLGMVNNKYQNVYTVTLSIQHADVRV